MRIRGRGGIGLNRNGVQSPSFPMDDVATDNPTVAASLAADSFMEMAKSMRRIEGELLALGELKSQTAAGAAGKASGAAEKAAKNYYRAIKSAMMLAERGNEYTGTISVTLGAGAGSTGSSGTVTAPWVTATSTIIGSIPTVEFPAASGNWRFFDVSPINVVAGSGFAFRAMNRDGANAGTYTISWIGFP